MEKLIFESRLLPDGHLYCPKEIVNRKNAHFKVIVTFEDTGLIASEEEIEQAAANDASKDYLSKDEIDYYLKLQEP